VLTPSRLLLALLALCLIGAPAAQAKPKPKVPLIKLHSGTTTIVPDLGFVSVLQGLSVTPTALPPGEATPDGFAFPIVTGTLAGKKAAAGEVRHFGGLRLSDAYGTHVDLNNLRVDDGKTKAVVTTQIGAGPRIDLATLDLTSAAIKVTKKSFLLANAGLLISSAAAQALNAQFGTAAFTAGQTIGTATVDAKIKLKLKPIKKK
jgi:hypothetical protein